MVQNQTYGSMERSREPRNKPTHPQLINLSQRRQEYTMEKRQSQQQGALLELDSYTQITENIYENIPSHHAQKYTQNCLKT